MEGILNIITLNPTTMKPTTPTPETEGYILMIMHSGVHTSTYICTVGVFASKDKMDQYVKDNPCERVNQFYEYKLTRLFI